jgi:hypothetical protein
VADHDPAAASPGNELHPSQQVDRGQVRPRQGPEVNFDQRWPGVVGPHTHLTDLALKTHRLRSATTDEISAFTQSQVHPTSSTEGAERDDFVFLHHLD